MKSDLIAALLVIIIAYLVGAFIQGGFNALLWNNNARTFSTSFIWGAAFYSFIRVNLLNEY